MPPHDEIYNLVHTTLKNTNTYMICNGDIWCHANIKHINDGIYGHSISRENQYRPCFMLARPALWNPAVFQEIKQQQQYGLLGRDDVVVSPVEQEAYIELDHIVNNKEELIQEVLLNEKPVPCTHSMIEVLATVIRWVMLYIRI